MVDYKKAMIRARNKSDGEKDSPEMDMPQSNEVHEFAKESDKPVEMEDLLRHEIDAVELYWQALQGNLGKKEKELIEYILKDEEDHLDRIKRIMGISKKELVDLHDEKMKEEREEKED